MPEYPKFINTNPDDLNQGVVVMSEDEETQLLKSLKKKNGSDSASVDQPTV